MASFSLAVDRDFKDKNTGERVTGWIDVVAWRSTGEFVAKYLAKGRMVVVEGRLQMRDWTDKEGNEHCTAEIVANSVYFADSKPNDGQGFDRGKVTQKDDGFDLPEGLQPGKDSFAELADDDGDLPF